MASSRLTTVARIRLSCACPMASPGLIVLLVCLTLGRARLLAYPSICQDDQAKATMP